MRCTHTHTHTSDSGDVTPKVTTLYTPAVLSFIDRFDNVTFHNRIITNHLSSFSFGVLYDVRSTAYACRVSHTWNTLYCVYHIHSYDTFQFHGFFFRLLICDVTGENDEEIALYYVLYTHMSSKRSSIEPMAANENDDFERAAALPDTQSW